MLPFCTFTSMLFNIIMMTMKKYSLHIDPLSFLVFFLFVLLFLRCGNKAIVSLSLEDYLVI